MRKYCSRERQRRSWAEIRRGRRMRSVQWRWSDARREVEELDARRCTELVEEIARLEKKIFPKHESLARPLQQESASEGGRGCEIVSPDLFNRSLQVKGEEAVRSWAMSYIPGFLLCAPQ